jgi:hypothetical protein
MINWFDWIILLIYFNKYIYIMYKCILTIRKIYKEYMMNLQIIFKVDPEHLFKAKLLINSLTI